MEGTQAPELEIQHEERGETGSFFVEAGGQRVAELRYSRGSGSVTIEHTEVSEALGGRGVGRKLVEEAVAWARRTGIRVVPVCPYAKKLIEREPALRDVLA